MAQNFNRHGDALVSRDDFINYFKQGKTDFSTSSGTDGHLIQD